MFLLVLRMICYYSLTDRRLTLTLKMISLLKEYFSKSQTILLPILLTAIASPLLWENLGVTAFAVVTPPP